MSAEDEQFAVYLDEIKTIESRSVRLELTVGQLASVVGLMMAGEMTFETEDATGALESIAVQLPDSCDALHRLIDLVRSE